MKLYQLTVDKLDTRIPLAGDDLTMRGLHTWSAWHAKLQELAVQIITHIVANEPTMHLTQISEALQTLARIPDADSNPQKPVFVDLTFPGFEAQLVFELAGDTDV